MNQTFSIQNEQKLSNADIVSLLSSSNHDADASDANPMATAKSKRTSFSFKLAWHKVLKRLEPLDRCRVYDAVFEYVADGTVPSLNGCAQIAFELIRVSIDDETQVALKSRRKSRKKTAEPAPDDAPPKEPDPDPSFVPLSDYQMQNYKVGIIEQRLNKFRTGPEGVAFMKENRMDPANFELFGQWIINSWRRSGKMKAFHDFDIIREFKLLMIQCFKQHELNSDSIKTVCRLNSKHLVPKVSADNPASPVPPPKA